MIFHFTLKILKILNLQLCEIFHITPLVKLFEILHQLKIVIKNSDLEIGTVEKKINRCFYQTLFLPVEPNISMLCKVRRAQQARGNVVQQPLGHHLNSVELIHVSSGAFAYMHLTTSCTPVAVEDAKKITSPHCKSRGIAVLNGVVGLQGVGVKELDWSRRQVGAGVLIVSENGSDLRWSQLRLEAKRGG